MAVVASHILAVSLVQKPVYSKQVVIGSAAYAGSESDLRSMTLHTQEPQ